MATTLVNNTQHKVVGVDVVLQRTVRGTMSTSYANLSNQVTTEIISKSSDCKVRGGETGQVDILATVPPMGKTSLVPTFESNFLKIYYELICVIRVKRSVFAGGDTTYQFTIPVPIATHNIDNPTISGRTPRWTKSRMQPYFFDHTWDNPAGDFPPQLVEEAPQVTNAVVIDSPSVRSGTPNSASAMSMTSSPSMNASAMQEFLASGSVGLHRERTMKKSLSRSKSLKDIQSARLNGSSWRAEKEHLLNQSREMGNNAGLSRSVTDAAPGGGSSSRRSPPLDAKSKASNEEKLGSGVGTTVVDGDGNVGYTPPPPSGATPRTQKSVNREMTPDQQAELARKASRRILPNQGLYTNEGVLPPELAHTGNQYPVPIPTPANNASAAPTVVNDYGNNSMNGNGNVGANSMSNRANNLSYSPPTPTTPISMAKIPPRRNASLSEKSHYQQQGGSGSGPYTQEPEPFEIPTRSGSQVNLNGNGFYDSSNGSRGRNGNGSSNGTGQTRSNQGSYQEGNRYGQESRSQPQPRTLSPQPVGGNKPVYPSSDRTPERVPYQHSLPAHQQPPGVVPGYNGNSSSDNNIARVNSGNYSALRIPPWERVEKVRHQNWFKPGPHQAGALQTFDVAGLVPSTLQAVPIVKKSTPRPMSPVQIEAAMN
ncbi:hypothetical protein BGW38_002165 [Lunasporangiospora selenospora]|uniref:Arrestin C-terminal-like domain-containing protein n=1 Tax=Lunasporangiospora selenospora TaxID=979761 RepID=A0A9P6FTM0_9FUNG|nr:hypothetical protein BGW38_002165 [Lunasporangiospora selenospora]